MIQERLEDLRTAIMLLTRLPVWPSKIDTPPDLARSVWAYPLVGAGIGLLAALCFSLALWIGLPQLLASFVTLACLMLLTGAFHEDGLADTVDALGGGQTKDAKLAIMKDSRIGTYGTVALVLSLAIRCTCLAIFPSEAVVILLVSLEAMSRGAIVLLLATLSPAREEGMGTVAANPPRWVVALGMGSTAPLLVIFPWPMGGVLLGAATVGAAMIGHLARRQLGGYTGDILGAAQQISLLAGWLAAGALVTL